MAIVGSGHVPDTCREITLRVEREKERRRIRADVADRRWSRAGVEARKRSQFSEVFSRADKACQGDGGAEDVT